MAEPKTTLYIMSLEEFWKKEIKMYSMGHCLGDWAVHLFALTDDVNVEARCTKCDKVISCSLVNLPVNVSHNIMRKMLNVAYRELCAMADENCADQPGGIRHFNTSTATTWVKFMREAFPAVWEDVSDYEMHDMFFPPSNPAAGIYASYADQFLHHEARELSRLAGRMPGMDYKLFKDCPALGEKTQNGNYCARTRISMHVGNNSAMLMHHITHLNDFHRWTREQIADWLDVIHDPTGENGPNLAFQVKEEQP